MKKLIRAFFKEALALYFVYQITGGLVFRQGLFTLLITSIGLTVGAKLFKPVVNLLLLPLNLVTFGLFRWVSNAITLYLVDLVLAEFEVSKFYYSGFATRFLEIPPITFDSGIGSYVGFAFFLSLIGTVIYWVLK